LTPYPRVTPSIQAWNVSVSAALIGLASAFSSAQKLALYTGPLCAS
jgi:hypothetical protein